VSLKLSPEYALIGILMAGPKHDYEIHGEFSSMMTQSWHLNMSEVYALLKRMEKSGIGKGVQSVFYVQ
jgi:DNA-binding PadR family transcriptional regulator